MAERSEEARTRRRGLRLLVGVTLALLTAAGVAMLAVRKPESAPVARKRVTVAAFSYGIADASLAPIAEMIPDWITRALVETGALDVIDAALPDASDSTRVDSSTVRRVAIETGAGTIVTGNYCRRGDSLEIEGILVDAASGTVLQALGPVRTPIETPLLGIDELKRRVIAALTRGTADSLATSDSARAPNYVAYAEFLQGLDAYDRDEWNAALRHFRRAQQLDPTFVQPQLTAALVFAEMRPATTASGDKADSVLRQVTARREQLGPLDRTILDWLNATRRGDRLGALEHMREAAKLWPDRFLYAVGHEAYRLNRPREAVDAFRRLDPQRGFIRGRDEYYADYTGALHALGEDREALRIALLGRAQYPDRVSALYNEAAIRSVLGEEDEVAKLLDQSLALDAQADRVNATPGEMMLTAGYELKAHGHPRAALGTLDRAAEWFARQPELVRVTPDTRKTLMAIDFARGRDVQAEGECRDMMRRRPSDTHTRWCSGMLAARRGDRVVADSIIEVLERMSGGRLPPVRRLYQAEIAAALGDRDRAVTLLRKGFTSGLPFGIEHHANPFLQSLVGFQPFDDLIRPKG